MNSVSLLLRLKVLLFVVAVASCGKGSGGGDGNNPSPPATNTFTNPLLSSGPDPWIIKSGSNYYYTHTLGNRVALWKTSKVSDLKNANPQTVWSAPANGANSKNVWAPELHFLENKWYVYYTAGSGANNTQRTFVLENASSDPLSGTWTDKGQIGDAAADYFAIDGTVLNYNNKNYFIWSGWASATDNNQRIYIARMSNPWTLETARSLISSPQYAWEMNGAPPAVNEGPEVLKNAAGKVFLIYSASGCWTDDYCLGMLTLKDGGDPLNASDWTKNTTPVFTKNTNGGAFGPGHNSFFKSVDGTEDWILYHANPQSGLQCGDSRSPRIQKFTWNADGTPAFGTPVNINMPITKPSGE
ncbi:glycoside hydrolase family 43 protein [Flavisolibacter ginsenosidimutans]|uniref:Family 43 glycosylhydrolase n=1 Tax=Flavisolibacter ginsenosidimutans TaxID=661481 RepID=A0A5B8UHH8_9BACT|nr:glycoside hydrolase family 43 protein [Flavisolibacter ginsenosidimutans]QEC56101.1 family 43 glycosylhydrolase [Flavisolibacter ginsenosidimutans]